MSEVFYTDRASHFNEERRLFASYLKSVTPDAHTMHHASLEARSLSGTDEEEILAAQAEDMKVRAAHLSSLFDQKTELIYKAKVTEEELQERFEHLQKLPPLREIEPDVTYYYRDSTYIPTTSKVSTSSKPSVKQTLPPSSSRRKVTGSESKLEADLQGELREINDLKASINRFLDSIEGRKKRHINTFSSELSSGNTKQRVELLLDEAETVDLQKYRTVIELLSLRLKVMVIQREELEDAERLQAEMEFYSKKATSVHMDLNNEITELNWKYEKEVLESVREYKSQLEAFGALERKLLQQKRVIEDEKHAAEEVARLRVCESAAKERYERLKLRNQLEMEGFNNQSIALRQRLIVVEKQCRLAQRK